MSYHYRISEHLKPMKATHTKVSACLALVAAALVLAFSSCKKMPHTIGNDLIDDNNYINVFFTDTAQVTCHSFLDTIGTKKVRYALLGGINDPVFGLTEAGFYTQFRFSSAGQNFGSAPVLDSVVLQLSLARVYGDTTAWQTVHVYQLTDSISSSDPYYSYSTVPCDLTDLANGFSFRPSLKSSNLIMGGDTITHPVIRIPLSHEFGQFLLQIDSSAYTNPDLFKNYFKGLCVTCDAVSQNGSVSSIELTNNTLTMLQLYYHDAAMPQNALRYHYYVTSDDNFFNHFDHDYTQGSPELAQQLLQGQTQLGQQKTYLQSMGGVRTRISFPNLPHWADTLKQGHILINEAKLILPAPPDIDTTCFTAPNKLVLIGFNADNTTYILPDNFEGDSYFGGSYNAHSKTVTFRISEYAGRIVLNKTENHGLSLGIEGASYNAYRWIINGPEAAEEQRMKLEVTYSIVNE